jgi:hypothetical protein
MNAIDRASNFSSIILNLTGIIPIIFQGAEQEILRAGLTLVIGTSTLITWTLSLVNF